MWNYGHRIFVNQKGGGRYIFYDRRSLVFVKKATREKSSKTGKRTEQVAILCAKKSKLLQIEEIYQLLVNNVSNVL
jgi:hypothetical protein